MSAGDSSLYTGVDTDPIEESGQFGNLTENKEVKALAREQERKLTELTPQLESIVEMIDNEKKVALDFLTGVIDDASLDGDKAIIEMKAAARYRKYLDELKTKFTLQLNETRGRK